MNTKLATTTSKGSQVHDADYRPVYQKEPLDAYWIDYNGNREDKRVIGPGSSRLERTYVAHPLLIAKKNGNCVGVYLPEPEGLIAISDEVDRLSPTDHVVSNSLRDCSTEKDLKSIKTKMKKPLTFHNLSKNVIKLFFLDFDGKRKFYYSLESGKKYYVMSFVSHAWVITDEKDQCKYVFPNTDDKIGFIDIQN